MSQALTTVQPKKQKKNIEKIEQMIITPEHLKTVELWTSMSIDVYKILKAIVNHHERDNDEFNIPYLIKRYLGITYRKSSTLRDVYNAAGPNTIEYFNLLKNKSTTLNIKKDLIDNYDNEVGVIFSGRFTIHQHNQEDVAWLSESDFRFFDGKARTIKTAELICVDAGAFKYLLAPEEGVYGSISMTVIAYENKLADACAHLKKFIDKHNTSRNFIRLYSGDINYMGYRNPKFKLPRDFAVFHPEIEEEINLLEIIIGTQKTRKVMFYGPPGTGKTTATERLMQTAIEKGVQVILVTDMESLSDLYTNVPTPALIILEDFDMATQDRNSACHDSRKINSDILQSLSTDVPGIITIATSNNCEGLDHAAIRSGRIDKSYLFDYPDASTKEAIATKMCTMHKQKMNKDLTEFVTNGKYSITGAIIEAIVKEKALLTGVKRSKPFKTIITSYIKHSLNSEFKENIV